MEEKTMITININGLNSAIKRRKIFHKLEKLKLDIICLQEVHIQKSHEHLLVQPKLGKILRGVIFYIKDKIPAKQFYTDEDGRILMDNTKKMLLIAIYAPNEKQDEFYKKLHKKISDLDYTDICMMGDFNGIINQNMDYKMHKTTKLNRKLLLKSFFKIIDEINPKDILKERNPTKKNQSTFYSNRHSSYSRIDMVLASMDLICNVQEVEIEASTWACIWLYLDQY